VRNPNLDKEIIEAILDPDDRHLTLSTAQREELGRAIFTNSKFIADTNMETEDFRDGYIWYLNDKHRSTLWKLAANGLRIAQYLGLYTGSSALKMKLGLRPSDRATFRRTE